MLKIDDNLLQELGLGSLPADDKRGLLGHIYETLEMRVGMRLADQMTDAQLDEFEKYFEARDDAGAFKWLEANFPNYKDIVNEEFEKLKAEVGQSAPQILASAQNKSAQPAMPQPGMQQLPPQGQFDPQQPRQPQFQAPQPQYGQPAQQPQYAQPQPMPQGPAPAAYQPQPGQYAAPAPQYSQPMPGADPYAAPAAQPQAQPQMQPQPWQQPPAGPGQFDQPNPAPQPLNQPQPFYPPTDQPTPPAPQQPYTPQ